MHEEHPLGLEIDSILTVIGSLDINYFFAEINTSTKLMINEFNKELSKNGHLINLVQLVNNPSKGETYSDMIEKVKHSIVQTINQTKSRTIRPVDVSKRKNIKNRIITASLPQWDNLSLGFKQYTIEYHTVSYLNSKINLRARNSTLVYDPNVITRQIWIHERPFAKGVLRFAYPAVLNVSDGLKEEAVLLNCVVKESISLDPQCNTKQYHEESLEIQVISNYLSFKFGQLFSKAENKFEKQTRMRFLDVDLIRVKETGVYYCIEEFVEGVFKKWSNNEGYVNTSDYAHFLNAFSHWTYTYTNEYLIVTDLQGFVYKNNEYILTDPAILCEVDSDRFGSTNLGSNGIREFFANHSCNKICKKLKLSRNVHQMLPDDI